MDIHSESISEDRKMVWEVFSCCYVDFEQVPETVLVNNYVLFSFIILALFVNLL